MANEGLDLDEILPEGSRLSWDDDNLFHKGDGFGVDEQLGDFEGYEGFESLTRSRPVPD